MWNRKGNIFKDHHSQLPVVDVRPEDFKIYYSTRDELGRSIPMSVIVSGKNLNQYESPERINLELGNPGSFDWSGIMPTDIITLEDGTKYLYYIGWSRRIDVPYHNNLGLAVSKDGGTTWEKYSKGPVFHTSRKEPGYIGTVDILIEDGEWRMWYLSCREWEKHDGIMEPIYDIKYATSRDGIDWDPTDQICIPLQNNEGGISSARVLKEGGTYTMWFSVRDKSGYRNNSNNSYRIKKAISKDGIAWEREQFIDLDISQDEWENMMVCYPEVVKVGNLYYMFYNGNGFGKTGIGYATKETA